MKYEFKVIERCNMCESPAACHQLLGKRLNGSQGFSPWKKQGLTVSVFQCPSCQLIYTNPQPIPVNIQDHYGIPPEDYWTQESLNYSDDYFSSEINISKELLNFKEGMKALDIGVGLGKCMRALAHAGYDVYGIEPSQPFHERAILNTGLKEDRLKLTTLEEATFPDSEFDFITFGAVLEHLYDPSHSIAKAMKWLKPGGIIQIEVPSSSWLVSRLLNLYYKARVSDYVSNLSPMHPPYHLYEFSLKSFIANGTRYGYDVSAYQYYVCRTYLPRFIDPIIKPWMRWTKSGMQLCVWLRKY